MEEVFAKVFEFLTSIEGASVTIAIVLDFVFRLIPSKKPLSIAYVLANGAKTLGNILVKLGTILDKVLPQKVKEE